jgi:hypothetical protein
MAKANGGFPFHDESLGYVFDGVIQHFEEEIEEYLESLPQRPPIDEFRERCRSLFRASQELVQRHPEARSFTKQLFSTFDEQLLKVLFQFELAYDAISELPETAVSSRRTSGSLTLSSATLSLPTCLTSSRNQLSGNGQMLERFVHGTHNPSINRTCPGKPMHAG